MQNKQTAAKPRFSRKVRILALILSILVTGTALTVILDIIFHLFA